MQSLVSPILLYSACVLGALGVLLALPRRGLSPQIIGALLGALALGVGFLAFGLKTAAKDLPNINFYLFSLIAVGAALRVISHPRPVYAALYFILTILASCGLYVLLSAEFMAFALVIVYAGAILITYLFVIMLATESPTAEQVEFLSEYDRYSREPVAATIVGFVLIAGLTTLFTAGSANLPSVTTYAGAQRIELLPRKVETSLRNAGLLAADEHIARDAQGEFRIDLTGKTTGGVPTVWKAYGERGAQVASVSASDPRWPKDLVISNVEGVGFTLLADHPGAIEIAGVVLLMAMLGAVVLARKKVELDEREKLAAQSRMLSAELAPDRSPLMGPSVDGSPNIREAAVGALAGGSGGGGTMTGEARS